MPTTPLAPRKHEEGAREVPKLLEEKKTTLSAELAKTRSAEEETTEESTQDIADKAVSSYTREFLYSLTDAERNTILQIDQALSASRPAPTACASTAGAMSEKRLTAVPWTPYCLECQELSEKGLLEG